MAHSYYAVYEHVVFSTKANQPFLASHNESTVLSYLAGCLKNMNCHCIAVGGHSEHIHILYRKPSDLLTRSIVKDLKHQSAQWLKQYNFVDHEFHWQNGYSAFSISYWDLEKLTAYIQNQSDHHREITWDQEYRQLLDQHGIEYYERAPLD